jgi:DNA-binding CsgD family transcriptional regulator/tetratricopeptide (TPR) repeat protein
VEVLRALAREDPSLDPGRAPSAGATEITRLVPELAADVSLDSGFAASGTMPFTPATPDDPARARFRLFDAVAAFLAAHATLQPQVIILDDLQWADASSLLLLQFVARSAHERRLLLVGTYRDVEVGPDHPLTATIAALNRERGSLHLRLHGLSPTATAALLAAPGADAATAFTRALHAFTAGNPLFIRETVRHLAETDRLAALHAAGVDEATVRATLTVSEGARGVIRQRLARLPAAARRVLAVAAVIGRGFDVATLSGVEEVHGLPLMEALDAAEAARLVTAGADAALRYRFTHDLIREAVYADLGRAARVRLHRQVGEALEARWQADSAAHVSEIAHHFVQAAPAGDAARAAAYARQAGERAFSQFAYDEAVRWHQLAYELLEAAAADAATRCDALLTLAEALLLAGNAWRVVDEVAPAALALAEALGPAGDGRAARACRLALAGLIRYAGPGSVVGTPPYRIWAERAARHAPPGTTDQVHADIALADALSAAGALPQTLARYRHALALARELDETDTLWYAAFQMLNWGGGPRHQAVRWRLAEEFSTRPRTGVSTRNVGRALFRCGAILLDRGERGRAEALWREVAGLAERARERDLLLLGPMVEAITATLDGRLDKALRACAWLTAWSADLGAPAYGRRYALRLQERSLLWLGRGVAEAQALLAELRTSPDVWAPGNSAGVTLRLVQAGRCPEAQQTLHEQVRRLWHDDGEEDATFPWHVVTLLELAVALQDRAACAELLPRLVALAPCATADWSLTTVARHLGAAAALLGNRPAARAYYEQALAVAGRIRFRPEVALVSLGLAELLEREPGEAARARELRSFALDELTAMQMQPALDRALLHRARVAGEPVTRRPAPAEGLTAREIEVLRLLATGRTNKQIAATLVVSPRTVQQHTVHIYAKLGVRGRADAVAYALRHGLVSSLAQ